MFEKPVISVIMSCYKEPMSILKQAVESILIQTYKDFEFIVIVDNPSNREIIGYLKNVSLVDRRVKMYVNKNNMGLVASLNKAICISRGKYIARMDADDISISTRLFDQLLYLEHNNLDFIGGYYVKITNDGIVWKKFVILYLQVRLLNI